MSEEQVKPMPGAPAGISDPEQLAGAEERWAKCPLRDCKKDSALLYEDFYLRDIRTNRLMCSACAVRAEMGYMAREVLKASDDRFFQGSQLDNLIVFAVLAGTGVLGAGASLTISFLYFSLIIGGAVGAAGSALARQWSGRRVTRQTPYVGIAGIILGAVIGTPLYYLLRYQFFDMNMIDYVSLIAAIVGMIGAAWGVLMRRI